MTLYIEIKFEPFLEVIWLSKILRYRSGVCGSGASHSACERLEGGIEQDGFNAHNISKKCESK